MDVNDISEKQAEKILRYLAERCGAVGLRWARYGGFALSAKIGDWWHEVQAVGINGWPEVEIPLSEHMSLDFLKKILELSAQGYDLDFPYLHRNPYPFLKRNTSLEEILIEMDLTEGSMNARNMDENKNLELEI